ncbi:AMP-dependent synthetase, partial [Micromonospora sp. KC207]|uniref:acyltransferase family protein n=1 Tax=Micromonospora sp. KC207 TaxID=2530377 RepID=UPI0010D2ADF9
ADGTDLCRLYARVLDADKVTADDSFVSLGGDSMSYVEMSVRLEEALGELPADWHTTAIRDLPRPAAPPGRRRSAVLETSVALRAAAIVVIVGSHIPLFTIKGGAHLLLAVAGFNFARFQLTDAPRLRRLRTAGHAIGRVVLPSVLWIAAAGAVTGDYTLTNVLLLNSVLGPHDGVTEWQFWFVEALVYILLGAVALLAVPAVDRVERRYPFGLPLAVAAFGLVFRYDLPGLAARGHVPSAVVVFWLFALGWAAARARSTGQRLVLTGAALLAVPGFFGQPWREALIAAGFVLLVWVPRLPSWRALNRVAGVLATSSLYIYLVHWQVLSLVGPASRGAALVVSLAAGVGVAALARVGARWLPHAVRVWARTAAARGAGQATAARSAGSTPA